MKIATFNINNINKRLANLLHWLRTAKPDVVSLQELKAADAEFPQAALAKAGYGSAWRGQKPWNGVAILGRDCEPIVTRTELPGDPADKQSRYIEAAVNGVLITSLYAPNGNPQPGPKFAHKLAWMERLATHAKELYGAGVPVVLAGDYNVVPTDRDIYPTQSYAKDALVQPESRVFFQRILEQGWVDAIRTLHPDAPMYTFWDYMRNRWPRDAGLRIDRGSLRRNAPAPTRRPLLVIDGDSLAHRAYHALPKTILRRGGRPAGAILGFANFLLKFYRTEQPRAVLVGWDTVDAPTYRHEQFPAYQSGREFDDELLEQLDALPEFVAACGFANAKASGYEADDFLASATAAEERRGGTVLVASGDRDTFQLASPSTTILYPVRAGEIARIGPAEVRLRYGVDPHQVPDFIALRGDPSDKLPGVAGLGAAGAAQVLHTYSTLENALKAGRFPAQAKSLRLFRSIATMDRKARLPRLSEQKPTWRTAAALAREWELKQLAKRLEKLAAQSSTAKS